MTIRTLVLSGGGGRGAFHAGVYKYLSEARKDGANGDHAGPWIPDVIVGTSIGAVNGAAIAQGISAADLESFWLSLREHDIQGLPPGMGPLARRAMNMAMRRSIGVPLPQISEEKAFSPPVSDSWPPLPLPFSRRLIGRWNNLLDTAPLYDTLVNRLRLDEEKLIASEKNLLISATNVRTGEGVVFSNRQINHPQTGVANPHIRTPISIRRIIASCSIPLVYPWTKDSDGEIYWDGAIVANTPFGIAFDAVRDRPLDEPMEVIVVMMTPWWEDYEDSPVPHDHLPQDFAEALTWTLDWALLASFRTHLKLMRSCNKMVNLAESLDQPPPYRPVSDVIVAPKDFLPVARIIDYDEPASRDLIQQGYDAAKDAFLRHFGQDRVQYALEVQPPGAARSNGQKPQPKTAPPNPTGRKETAVATLPVREMVLYKHGVGFFVREGEFNGTEIDLSFKAEEINDVLKSLAVFDKGGGQVLGIHYQTPMDKAARLANTSINLGNHTTLSNLLRDLRGRLVTLTFQTDPNKLATITGRVVGVEMHGEAVENHTVSVLAGDGTVRNYPLAGLHEFKIEDSQAAHDLKYFLDTEMREDNRRTVNVRLSEGAHDLAVYYVAPSPTWRVSYRLVAESEEGGGKALLQGWGLFDNRLEEDLEDVRVTLVAGQPISFIYDLYASKIPQRPTVQDESRIAPGPIEFEEAERAPEPALQRARMAASAPASMRRRTSSKTFAIAGAEAAPRLEREAMADSAPVQAEGKATGETFQYAVTTPVSVKRGESALVPILGSEVKYQRELLYNGNKLRRHPVAALRFENTTGLTLERGPVTVVEDGDYKGEAVIPFTGEDGQVYVPYAVELGVRVLERTKNRQETTGLHIDGKLIVTEYRFIQETIYTLKNNTNDEKTVTIEASKTIEYELFDTPPTDSETQTERRWKVTVPARETVEFVRRERRLSARSTNLLSFDRRDLKEALKNRWLDDALFTQLDALLEKVARIDEANKRQDDLGKERELIYKKQENLRQNLSALQPTGPEATLRGRMLEQLESSQDRLEAIDTEIKESEALVESLEAEIDAEIERLAQSKQEAT